MEVDECKIAEELLEAEKGVSSQTTIATAQVKIKKVKAPRKLVEDEARAIGQIGQVVWKTYLPALGHRVLDYIWIHPHSCQLASCC